MGGKVYPVTAVILALLGYISSTASAPSSHVSTPSRENQTERRLALVIGIDDYPNKPLRLPVRDAELVARELERVQFEVTLVKNPSKGELA